MPGVLVILLFVLHAIYWINDGTSETKKFVIDFWGNMLRRRPKVRIDHPVFGEMLGHDGQWEATYNFSPTGEKFDVRIFDGDDDGPTQWQQDRFVEMIDKYPSIRRDMEQPLWKEYEKIRKSWKLESRPLDHPSEIWSVATLFAIEVYNEGFWTDYSFDHQIDWENEDHDLNVSVKDWKVVQVGMEG